MLTDTTDSDSQTITEDVPAMVANRQLIGIQGRTGSKLKVNDRIQYKMRDADQWVTAKIMGRAGKATGKYKDWYNIRDEDSNDQKSIDQGQYVWEKLTTENVQTVACKIQDYEIEIAKKIELKRLWSCQKVCEALTFPLDLF